jgi:hypothetical protein
MSSTLLMPAHSVLARTQTTLTVNLVRPYGHRSWTEREERLIEFYRKEFATFWSIPGLPGAAQGLGYTTPQMLKNALGDVLEKIDLEHYYQIPFFWTGLRIELPGDAAIAAYDGETMEINLLPHPKHSEPFSETELSIVRYIQEGFDATLSVPSIKELKDKTGAAEGTVKNQLRRMRDKIGNIDDSYQFAFLERI